MSAFSGYADLEIALEGQGTNGYGVQLTFTPRGKDRKSMADWTAKLDFSGLAALRGEDKRYSELLTSILFSSMDMRLAWKEAVAIAKWDSAQLRLHLYIASNAKELHGLRWELLSNPDDSSQPLLGGERFSLSRQIQSTDNRPSHPPTGRRLRALFMAANPKDVKLSPIKIVGEEMLVSTRLKQADVTKLVNPGEACSSRIQEELRQGYDLLYLVCHGGLLNGEPMLYFWHADSSCEMVKGADFAAWIADLPATPRLIVLASCQSAGSGGLTGPDEEFLSTLGPLLAEKGVPAVVGMQGSVSEATSQLFFDRFFELVMENGEIEPAVSLARAAVRERPDWWMPVLFSTLIKGELWSPRAHHENFREWSRLLNAIDRGNCLPVLGSGLVQDFLGSNREIAQDWAGHYGMPELVGMRDQLPQVAEYLRAFANPLEKLEDYFDDRIRARGGTVPPTKNLSAEISRLGQEYRKLHAPDIHDVLAKLPCKFFLSAKPDDLMADALRDADARQPNEKKKPTIKICPWHLEPGRESTLYTVDKVDKPTEDRPFVYHVFGHLLDLESIVLTEDNSFDLMFWIGKGLIPKWLTAALVDSTLLFLGFRLEDWDFRMLLRCISKLGGAEREKDQTHIAVQIDAPGNEEEVQQKMREYFDHYFGRGEDIAISIYWGSIQQFAEDLRNERNRPAAAAAASGGHHK